MHNPNILDSPEEQFKYRHNFILQLLLSSVVFVLSFAGLFTVGDNIPFLTNTIDVFGFSFSPMAMVMVSIITASIAIIVGTSYKARSYFWIMTRIVLIIITGIPIFLSINEVLIEGRPFSVVMDTLEDWKPTVTFIMTGLISGTGLYLGFKKNRWISCILFFLLAIIFFEIAVKFIKRTL